MNFTSSFQNVGVLFYFSLLFIINSSSIMTSVKAEGLLRIIVSVRGPKSYSLQALEKFTDAWKLKYPDLPVIDRSVFNIPHMNYEEMEAGRTAVKDQTPELQKSFALANLLTDELLACKHLVIATPMHNWGPPSSLKAWIDRVINCRTFYGRPNLLAGLPITFIVASGGPYSADAGVPQMMKHDHLRPSLIEWFTQMGAKEDDLEFINLDPTGPIDAGKIDINDPNNGFNRGLKTIPNAAERIKL